MTSARCPNRRNSADERDTLVTTPLAHDSGGQPGAMKPTVSGSLALTLEAMGPPDSWLREAGSGECLIPDEFMRDGPSTLEVGHALRNTGASTIRETAASQPGRRGRASGRSSDSRRS